MSEPKATVPSGVIRVTHVITGLMVGGAETMLARLLSAMVPRVESNVICLSAGGPIADRIRNAGFSVETLGLRPGPGALLALPRLVEMLKKVRPDVVHTWLYHADLLGGIAAKVSGLPVVWGLHNSTLDPERLGRSTLRTVRVLAALSRFIPSSIVSCSDAGLRVHASAGYDLARMIVIPNGFDTQIFQPSRALRSESRALWGSSPEEIVVGLVARFHPMKDHETFLKAAGLALQRVPQLRFILYGEDITPENAVLTSSAHAANVYQRCSFLGPEPAIHRRLPGLDLLVSSSTSEAFPLVLGEAMACGVRCVATDVGDSAAIVDDRSRIVPAANPEALADAIVRAVQLSADERSSQASAGISHIQTHFALEGVAERFRSLYWKTASLP